MEFSSSVEEEQASAESQKPRVENPIKKESLGDVVENNYSEYADKAPREQREHEQRLDEFKGQEYAGSKMGSNSSNGDGGNGSVYNSTLAAYDNGKKGGCDCCENLPPEWKYHK